jgi:p-cumate 2,3-dioxygenase beta subunit
VSLTRAQVEDFLYAEAALLDEWKLKEWFSLLTEDVVYLVPATDAREADPNNALAIIYDDARRLRSRVEQLLGTHAWAENPPSRTRRLIGNVRLRSEDAEGQRITANFNVARFRNELVEHYIGRYEYTLVLQGGAPRIRRRTAILDLEALRPHGKLSIIL